ncbi:MAG: hypothetical protein WD276_06995 [Actinomycetota bacterium]
MNPDANEKQGICPRCERYEIDPEGGDLCIPCAGGYEQHVRAAESESINQVESKPRENGRSRRRRPTLPATAFHGVAGELVRAAEPETEADNGAVLLTSLTLLGNAMGSGPHARVGRVAHPPRLNTLVVGETARSRKGTSFAVPQKVLELAEPEWAADRITTGLSTGEGLIHSVRDASGDDPGVADKRLLVYETEFGRTLRVLRRETNTLSPVIRQAYDDGNLRVMTRKDPLRATGAHISIVGHVTNDELVRQLSETEMAAGFANRFLYAAVSRSKILPEGGNFDPRPVAVAVSEAIRAGRQITEMRRSRAARELWEEVYAGFGEGPHGLLGTVTARPDAQTLRLSVLFAALDGTDVIEDVHVEAAFAVWSYSEESATYIFGDLLGDPDADRLLEGLKASYPHGLTYSEQHALFGRNFAGPRIDRARGVLERAGLAQTTSRDTAGRARFTTTYLPPRN